MLISISLLELNSLLLLQRLFPDRFCVCVCVSVHFPRIFICGNWDQVLKYSPLERICISFPQTTVFTMAMRPKIAMSSGPQTAPTLGLELSILSSDLFIIAFHPDPRLRQVFPSSSMVLAFCHFYPQGLAFGRLDLYLVLQAAFTQSYVWLIWNSASWCQGWAGSPATSCLQPASLSGLCSLIIFITESDELPHFLAYSFFFFLHTHVHWYIHILLSIDSPFLDCSLPWFYFSGYIAFHGIGYSWT